MDVAARLEVVEMENEVLRDRIEQLLQMLREVVPLPLAIHLTSTEESLVGFLLKRESVVSKEQILTALYSHKPDADEPEIKIVDVFVCKARKKLKPFGITIETAWGRGYFMPPASKAILRKMAAGWIAEHAA